MGEKDENEAMNVQAKEDLDGERKTDVEVRQLKSGKKFFDTYQRFRGETKSRKRPRKKTYELRITIPKSERTGKERHKYFKTYDTREERDAARKEAQINTKCPHRSCIS